MSDLADVLHLADDDPAWATWSEGFVFAKVETRSRRSDGPMFEPKTHNLSDIIDEPPVC